MFLPKRIHSDKNGTSGCVITSERQNKSVFTADLKVFHFSVIIYFLVSCNTAKTTSYSFNIDRYVIDTANHLLGFSSLISYGDYLFEYKITTHFNTIINHRGESSQSVVYDTTGVYLLSGKTKRYCEFDSFGLNSKILGKGPFSAKPTGAGVTPVQQVAPDSSDAYYGPPQPVSINRVACYYSHVMLKSDAPEDSTLQSAILVKKENFNSLYKIRGIQFMDTAYCIIGFRKTHLLNDETFVEQINNLRPLTDKEIKICKLMIKRSGI